MPACHVTAEELAEVKEEGGAPFKLGIGVIQLMNKEAESVARSEILGWAVGLSVKRWEVMEEEFNLQCRLNRQTRGHLKDLGTRHPG